jgi:hypothetical protein
MASHGWSTNDKRGQLNANHVPIQLVLVVPARRGYPTAIYLSTTQGLWTAAANLPWLIGHQAAVLFSLTTNQPPSTSQQYFSLGTNQHQPSATGQTNRLLVQLLHCCSEAQSAAANAKLCRIFFFFGLLDDVTGTRNQANRLLKADRNQTQHNTKTNRGFLPSLPPQSALPSIPRKAHGQRQPLPI